jgi:hypothetical protein
LLEIGSVVSEEKISPKNIQRTKDGGTTMKDVM